MEKNWIESNLKIEILGEHLQHLKAGIDKVANVVKITMGARGMKVIAERKWAKPLVTNDGVTVARGIELDNPWENQGCLLLKEAAEKTNDDTGDGTTTVTLFVQSIVSEGLKNITSGANPQAIVRGMEKATECVIETLKKNAIKIRTCLQKEQVAAISAGNPTWGNDIVSAIQRVGKDGVVTVEEGSLSETTIDVIKGMQFENGYISPFFITKPERMECILEDPYLILIDREIVSIRDILPIIEKIMAKKKPYVLVCNDVGLDTLRQLVINKINNMAPGVAVRAPAVGDKRKEILGDIAALTGGKVLSADVGIELDKVMPGELGRCLKVIINRDFTTILGGKPIKKELRGRIRDIKEQTRRSLNDFEKDKLEDRLARITGGIGQIMVGASTETEMKAKFYKYEDALNATKAAIQEGIVPGGGVAYLDCINQLKKLKVRAREQVGVDIIERAIKQPIIQICDNAGQKGEMIMLESIKMGRGMGYDVEKEKFVNMVKAGIIDPVKVARLALENAVSVSKEILRCGAVIVDIPEESLADGIKRPDKRRYGRTPGKMKY